MTGISWFNRQPVNPYSRARGVAAVLALALATAVAFSYAGNKSQEEAMPHFRWTGSAGDRLWNNPANWQVRDASGEWMPAEAPPIATACVIFGDETEVDEQQLLDISAPVTVARVVMAAKSDKRDYRIRSRVDPNDTGIDSDSGMVYSLTITDPVAIIQEVDVKAMLGFELEVILTGENPTVELKSRHEAVVRFERNVQPDIDEVSLTGAGEDGVGGTLIQLRPVTGFSWD